MGCCGSTTTGAGAAPLDTGKRVNYTKGMLLGVDDFVQEQAWHIARRHELAREVLGYGTVRGLQVVAEGTPPRVRVTPGVALMPSGTPVCVPGEQCCDLNDWIDAQWNKEVADAVAALPAGAALPVYVVLAYDSGLTDLLPVPGEPCRSEAALTAASRVADCFRLDLRLRPPDQVEENAIRDFADWLAQVPVDRVSPPLTERRFLDGLRDAARGWLLPSSPPPGDFMLGTPPAGLESTDALLRAALRLWATELRPLWRARYGCGPSPVAPGGPDDAVLLAALQVRLTGRQAQVPVEVQEDARPVLMSLRMLQELVTQNPAPEPAQAVVAADLFGLPAEVGQEVAYARADHSHGTPTPTGDVQALDVGSPGVQELRVLGLRGDPIAATPPVNNDVLVFDGSTWAPRQRPLPGATVATEQRFGQASNAGAAATETFARSDHTHGTPTLRGDAEAVDVGSPAQQEVRVRGLRGVPVDPEVPTTTGHVLTVQPRSGGGVLWKAMALPTPPGPGSVLAQTSFGLAKSDGANATFARSDHVHGTPRLSGDLEAQLVGSVQEARVVGLQGKAIARDKPQPKQVLTFNGTEWAPADPAASNVPAAGTTPPPGLTFGGTGQVGTGTAYALANHTHSLPNVELAGDVKDKASSNSIGRLQGVDLITSDAKLDYVLMRTKDEWRAAPFVRRFGPSRYEFVAAAEIRVLLQRGQGAGIPSSATTGTSVDSVAVGDSDVIVMITAQVMSRSADDRFAVGLTPLWLKSQTIEFSPYLVDKVTAEQYYIHFTVRLRTGVPLKDLTTEFRFQFEVNRYGAEL